MKVNKKRLRTGKSGGADDKIDTPGRLASELRGSRVRAAIWHDEAFLRLSSDAQRLYLMLATMPEEHISGLTTMAPETMGARLRLTARRVRACLVELMQAGFVVFDDVGSLCPLFWVLGHYEVQLGCMPTTDEHIAGTGKYLQRLPQGATLTKFCQRYGITASGIEDAQRRLQCSLKARAASRAARAANGRPPATHTADPLTDPLRLLADPLTEGLGDPPMHIAVDGGATGVVGEEVRRVG